MQVDGVTGDIYAHDVEDVYSNGARGNFYVYIIAANRQSKRRSFVHHRRTDRLDRGGNGRILT